MLEEDRLGVDTDTKRWTEQRMGEDGIQRTERR